jgi:hypothetical protein
MGNEKPKILIHASTKIKNNDDLYNTHHGLNFQDPITYHRYNTKKETNHLFNQSLNQQHDVNFDKNINNPNHEYYQKKHKSGSMKSSFRKNSRRLTFSDRKPPRPPGLPPTSSKPKSKSNRTKIN